MKTFRKIMTTGLLLFAVAAIGSMNGCGGRNTNNNDDGNAPDNGETDTNTVDPDAFVSDGPIAKIQKTDLSVVCPPEGTDTAPGFQNGETDIVMDVVVTAPGSEASATLDRYFVAEAALSTATPWTGAAMTVSKELGVPDLDVGDVLTVTVSHLEYYCMTQLTVTSAAVLYKDAGIAPADVTAPAEIGSQDRATAEKYEGVLVRLANVRVTNANLGYGQFEVTGGVIIKPTYGLTYQATLDDGFDEIVGVVDYSYGTYVVLPRSNADLVLEGGQTIDVIEPGDMIEPADVQYELPDGVEPPTSIIALQSSDDSTGCATVNSITTVQDDMTFNDLVVVSPKFVASSGKLDGYYVCQGLLDSLLPYSCMAMTIDVAATEKFAAGDIVDVSGKYIEYYCFSEISATSATKVGTATLPLPITVSPEDLGSQASGTAEPLEGILVRIEDVEITESPTNGSDGKDHGAFKVTGDAVIGNQFYLDYMKAATDGRAVGQKFLSITGVVAFSYGRYEIMPRSIDDLEFDGDPIVVEKDQPDVIEQEVSDDPYTVFDIQTRTESTGCTANGFVNVLNGVAFAPVIVVTPKFSASSTLDGYYVMDYGVGGSLLGHGSIVVAEKTLATAFAAGDVVSITDGNYYEYYCMSQIEINAAEKTGTDTVPPPVEIQLSALENGGLDDAAASEELEGLLVTIPATTITAATSTDAKTWFEVGNKIHIDKQFYIQDFTPVADTALSSITGVIRYNFGKYRLAPRTAADIVLAQ